MSKFFNYVENKKAQEEGEVASWLILAAGLAAAAVLAAGVLGDVIGELADRVATAAGI